MEILEEKLKLLGLNEKEAIIYRAILQGKKATIIDLAKATGTKRTTVYHCLDALVEKSLVNRVMKDGHKYYYAEDPEESLKLILKEKEDVIKKLIPDLKSIFGTNLYQPEIEIYRNINGIRKILEDILSVKESVVRYYLSEYNVEDMAGADFVDEFVKKRIASGVKSLALRSFKYKPEREKISTHAKQLREVRFVPENIIIKPYICIYDDKVTMISTKEEKLGFIIKSHEFAEAQKAIFDMIWNGVAI
ncbi:MAG: helix-turn-helix domain-containing protein [Candidatus Moraniibacteriota bacterium]